LEGRGLAGKSPGESRQTRLVVLDGLQPLLINNWECLFVTVCVCVCV